NCARPWLGPGVGSQPWARPDWPALRGPQTAPVIGEPARIAGSARVLTEIPITQRDVSCRFRPPTQYSDDWSADAAPTFYAHLIATAWPRWPNPPRLGTRFWAP